MLLLRMMMLLLLEHGFKPMIITRLILSDSCLSIVGQIDQGILVYASPLVELPVDVVVCGVGSKADWQRFERARLPVLLLRQLDFSSVILASQ